MARYELRDPIHQTIGFDEREKAVIDHPVFQRMRYVRQLGLSYLVYPGATHDRFSHMLGAMHLAGRVWDSILASAGSILKKNFSPKELAYFRRILRFAALLHDVGHAPFSHTSEALMPKFGVLEIPKAWYLSWQPQRRAAHEDYSVMLIAALSRGPGAPLDPAEAQDVASLLHHGVRPSDRWVRAYGRRTGRASAHRLLSSLISGELDVDRMDYLLRDAYYAGVAYGVYDIDHLIRNLGVAAAHRRLTLAIDATAMRAFEAFLLARYHMFLQVYHHKTINGFEYFLKQAFAAGEVGLRLPGSAEGYLRMRDSTYLEALFAAAQDPKNVWSKRLVDRRPAKRLYASSGDRPGTRETLRKIRRALVEAGVPHFAINSHQYLSKLDPFRTQPREGSRLLVREKRLGKVVYAPVEQYSSLLRKYNEAIDSVTLYVLPEHLRLALKVIASLPGLS